MSTACAERSADVLVVDRVVLLPCRTSPWRGVTVRSVLRRGFAIRTVTAVKWSDVYRTISYGDIEISHCVTYLKSCYGRGNLCFFCLLVSW